MDKARDILLLSLALIFLTSLASTQTESLPADALWLDGSGSNSVVVNSGGRFKLYADKNTEAFEAQSFQDYSWEIRLKEYQEENSYVTLEVDSVSQADSTVTFTVEDLRLRDADYTGDNRPGFGKFQVVRLRNTSSGDSYLPDFTNTEPLIVDIKNNLDSNSDSRIDRSELVYQMVITGRTDSLDRDFGPQELWALGATQSHGVGSFVAHVNEELHYQDFSDLEDRVGPGATVRDVVREMREYVRESPRSWNKGALNAYNYAILGQNPENRKWGLNQYEGEGRNGEFYQSRNGYILNTNTPAPECYENLSYTPPSYPSFIPQKPDIEDSLDNREAYECPTDQLRQGLSWITEERLTNPRSYCAMDRYSSVEECINSTIKPTCGENPVEGSTCYALMNPDEDLDSEPGDSNGDDRNQPFIQVKPDSSVEYLNETQVKAANYETVKEPELVILTQDDIIVIEDTEDQSINFTPSVQEWAKMNQEYTAKLVGSRSSDKGLIGSAVNGVGSLVRVILDPLIGGDPATSPNQKVYAETDFRIKSTDKPLWKIYCSTRQSNSSESLTAQQEFSCLQTCYGPSSNESQVDAGGNSLRCEEIVKTYCGSASSPVATVTYNKTENKCDLPENVDRNAIRLDELQNQPGPGGPGGPIAVE